MRPNETEELVHLLEAGSSLPTLIISTASIPFNAAIIFILLAGTRKPDSGIHMMLLAVADILFVTTPWMMFALLKHESANDFATVNWSWRVYEYVSTVTITQNRWMTFLMAFKRFLCLFSFEYAMKIRDKTTWENFLDNFLLGFVFGLVQGIALSCFMYYEDIKVHSKAVRYFVLNIHPIITLTTMIIITTLMIWRLKGCTPHCLPPVMEENNPVAVEFRRAIICVVAFFSLAQMASIIYFLGRGRGEAMARAFQIRWICLVLNSSVNFFIYCLTSATFRFRIKKIVTRNGTIARLITRTDGDDETP